MARHTRHSSGRKMISKNPSECCGCTACANVCRSEAITMEPDALGFLYPKVDASKCVGCGACDKVCAFGAHYSKNHLLPEPKAYAVRHKSSAEVALSRSGAAFVALSDAVLNAGGVVYGAGYADHFRVVHKRAATPERRNEMRGSKYVQSDLSGIFPMVRADLQAGLTVLFSGTPCQTAGLASYIGESLRPNLLLVDIVCHGVPSPYVWRDYLQYIEEREGEKVQLVNFRDKAFGWHAHRESFLFNDRKVVTQSYKELFYRNIMLRRSCTACPYTNTLRPSDVTISDFWGSADIVNGFPEGENGVSMLIVNTASGERLFGMASGSLLMRPVTLDAQWQPNLNRASRASRHRDAFEREYAERSFRYVLHKYSDLGWRYKVKQLINKFLK